MAGWIKLHRKFKQWEWYRDTNVKCLFLHLLLEANTESANWKGICDVERGELITSVEQLHVETGLSTQEIRTALKKLTNSHSINKQSTNKYTKITICKFEDYQYSEETINKQATSKTTSRATTIKEERILYNNLSTSTERTHARDGTEDEIDNDIKQLQESTTWIEQICMKHKILPDQLPEIFEAFAAECRCNGLKSHQNLKDAQSHFNNWLRIYKKQSNGDNSKSSYQRTSPADNIAAAQQHELERTAAIIAASKK